MQALLPQGIAIDRILLCNYILDLRNVLLCNYVLTSDRTVNPNPIAL